MNSHMPDYEKPTGRTVSGSVDADDSGFASADGIGCVIFLFDRNHRAILFQRSIDADAVVWDLPYAGAGNAPPDAEEIAKRCGIPDAGISPPTHVATLGASGEDGLEIPGASGVRLCFAEADGGMPHDARCFSIQELRRELDRTPEKFSGPVRFLLPRLDPYLIRLPYLRMRESDYIYRFRTERQRNRDAYRIDDTTGALYQSALCEAIKTVKRQNERSPEEPALLDFGPVRYVLPSHFGFCLGVQNAIERAYECLAENPGRAVYMLSELIHNPFVNDDLNRRGLRYLQTDKGKPISNPDTGRPYWEEIGPDDIVVIPAFGATNEDKIRLIEKGISINRYDATCMLVEKVWKGARKFGADGYTVVIHGKSEHEETKATFSNSAESAPSLIIRNMEEARALGEVIIADDPAEKRERFRIFAGKHTPGFSPENDLERIAVVNQTTLLRNETLGIIDHLESVLTSKYGEGRVRDHLHSGSRGDTLCYATQVNQNALEKALEHPLDVAVVVGGRNSSNTFQLFRMCERKLGSAAFYIQSEESILSRERVRHYVFPPEDGEGRFEERPFPPASDTLGILITGGASCPDGLIQQVICRINGFFPDQGLRSIDEVLATGF